jgi:hypothetical protein
MVMHASTGSAVRAIYSDICMSEESKTLFMPVMWVYSTVLDPAIIQAYVDGVHSSTAT